MLLIIAIILLATLYILIKNHYSYWEKEGIPYLEPNIPFGNLKSVVKREKSFGTAIYDLYLMTKEPFVGIYSFYRPALLVRDVEIVKHILVKDFEYFHDRGVYCNEQHDRFSGDIFKLPGEKWKNLRQSLSPTFTSGKLKSMFTTLMNVGEKLKLHLDPLAEANSIIEIKSLAGKYVGEVLASVAFGLETNGIDNPDDEFAQNARLLNEKTTYFNAMRSVGVFMLPSFLKAFGIQSSPQFVRDFIHRIVGDTISHRTKNNVERKDLMQYLIQMMDKSNSKSEDWKVEGGLKKGLDFDQICAQAFIFYIAGSETTSSLVAYTIHEFTQNPELMEKARAEIFEILNKHNNEISYDSIQEMKFVDLCIKESLRKYPGLPILNRIASRDYKIPGHKYTIKKGTPIVISLMGQHMDEANFPNPKKFDPYRFVEETKNFNPNAYMPFGDGPRNCVAYRLGRMVGKIAIVLLLANYDFTLLKKGELDYNASSVGLLPKNGIKVKISKIKKLN